MCAAKFVDYGHFLLREMIHQSGIFDFWYAELRGERAYVPCLVRRVLPPYSQGADYVRTFRTRCQDVQSVQHPCIIRPLEYGVIDTIPHAVFGLSRGWNLEDLLYVNFERQQGMPPDVMVAIILPLIHLLASTHARPNAPLVHGALQPSAVWVEAQGMVKVSDFDVGALAEFVIRSYDKGAPALVFVAPERSQDWAHPSPSVDVYSVGALMLEMLIAGRLTEVQLKLDPADQLAILYAQRLPKVLLQVVASCLREDVEGRPDMATLHRQLKDMLAQVPSPIPLPSYLQSMAPPMRETAHLARGDAEVLRCLQEIPRDENAVVESTMNVAAVSGEIPEAEQMQPEAPGRPRLTMGILIAVTVFVLGLVGFQMRHQIAQLARGPGGNMALAIIESDPPGATIALSDGRVVGQAPLRVPVHINEDGTVEMSARLDGYFPSSPIVQQAEAGRNVTFNFVLEKRPEGPATARVITVPPGARISADGKVRGDSPIDITDLFSTQTHTIEASMKGYKTASKEVKLEAGETLEVVLELEKLAAKAPTGYIMVQSFPPAQLSVDGRVLGMADGGKRHPVAVGWRTINLYDSSWGRQATYRVQVRAGNTEVLEYSFDSDRWSSRAYQPEGE